MSTLTERITNGTVEIPAQNVRMMSRFQVHLTQADYLTAAEGTRGVTEIFTLGHCCPFRHDRIGEGGRP